MGCPGFLALELIATLSEIWLTSAGHSPQRLLILLLTYNMLEPDDLQTLLPIQLKP